MPTPALLPLVLASSNAGKLAELRALLTALPVEIVSVREALGRSLEVVEDGETFEANALLKATAVCEATGRVALADDSGLEVDALNGRPGVHSARFAHDHATDAENVEKLLQVLGDSDRRTARFRCVLAVVTPWGDPPLIVQGSCEGSIARTPRGDGGFGYDPLFIVDDLGGRTMAELGEREKNEVSHRGRAMRALEPKLAELVQRVQARAPAGTTGAR